MPASDHRRRIPDDAVITSWEAPDGWRIRRIDFAPPVGISRGSLLFAGGRGDFIEKYLESLCHWHTRGWAVTSFDWRGQGRSAGTIERGHLTSFDPLVEDAAALIDGWQASSPRPHVLIGHSMGGHLLLRVLAERRAHPEAAVLIAPMIGINAGPIPPWLSSQIADLSCAIGMSEWPAWREEERSPPAGSLRQTFLTGCRDRYADELWWKEQEPGFELGPPTWGWLAAAYASIGKLERALRDPPDLPILLLGSEKDRLVSADSIRRTATLLPHGELHMFPHAAHEILRESDPVRLDAMQRIDAFLDQAAARIEG